MTSLLLMFLAGFINAVMDNIKDHWYKSVFNVLDPKFWCPDISWKTAKKIFGWKFDAWHVAKSIVVILVCLAIVLYEPFINRFADFLIAGLLWNGGFNLGYNHLLNRK